MTDKKKSNSLLAMSLMYLVLICIILVVTENRINGLRSIESEHVRRCDGAVQVMWEGYPGAKDRIEAQGGLLRSLETRLQWLESLHVRIDGPDVKIPGDMSPGFEGMRPDFRDIKLGGPANEGDEN